MLFGTYPNKNGWISRFYMKKTNLLSNICNLFLFVLIVAGIAFRFLGMNWNSGTNLHPDEYGLTNTLTQLSFPQSFDEYFNTRLSPISPYNKYDFVGQLTHNGPDNRMRWGQWPLILIRGLAEITGNTGYNELRMMGRYLSAFVDTCTLLFLFLIGKRLYGLKVGLLGCAFSGLAVMQIQQSHFMTVDNYAVFFSTLVLYAAVRISQSPPLVREPDNGEKIFAPYRINQSVFTSYILFGIALGMALASKINLLPLAGLVLIASFVSIADLKLKQRSDINKIFITAGVLILVSYIATVGTFRITQPMSFRSSVGDTSLFTLQFNADWTESMKVSMAESKGEAGGPPSEQWADRPMILFPLINLVIWGMGVPLGAASWFGWGRAVWQILKGRASWRQHILPVVWVGGFFFFMATRWVKSIRYFLPIYPFLCLLAAWGLLNFVNHIKDDPRSRALIPRTLSICLLIAVVISTFSWVSAFTQAVYYQPNTRVRATRWIIQNIPGPLHLQLVSGNQTKAIPVPIADGTVVSSTDPLQLPLNTRNEGVLTSVTLPHILNPSNHSANLTIKISLLENPLETVGQVSMLVYPSIKLRGDIVSGEFREGVITSNLDYLVTISTDSIEGLAIFQNTIAAEDWDEGIPVPLDGYDPYGGLYRGITMPVRWTDDDSKRETILNNLEQVDYITLSSQRALWSVCRLQQMYPMTIQYYRTLFDGRLGFDQVASFQAPLKIGPLQISDAGGTIAWGSQPSLPVFNFNLFAAEEAFTVYDHAPVWVFKKSVDYTSLNASTILNSIDLSQAEYQSPFSTKVTPIR